MCFGILHLDLAQGLGAGVLGVYLAAVALAARSTWAAIAAHIANNLMALAGAAWAAPETAASPLAIAMAFAATGVGLGALWRLRPIPLQRSG